MFTDQAGALPAFLSTEQVAEATGLPAYTIRQAAQAGALRGFRPGVVPGRPGKSWRFRPADVEAWITAGAA